MAKAPSKSAPDHPTPRQIVGISLPPATASAFKAEAGRRGVSLRTLFEEMWAVYEKGPKAKA